MKDTSISTENFETQTPYDVIIAGGGPVGLFLACELALAQCTVLLLEKAAQADSPLKQLPFGVRGLNALSVEALHRRGMLHELELHKRFTYPHTTASAAPSKAPQGGGHFAGISLQVDKIDFSQWPYRLPNSTATSLLTELSELEAVLTRRAEALGVAIRRGVALSGFQQTADGVTVEAGGHAWAGQWLVGCDGSRSAVRKMGGFNFAGTEPEFTGYSAQVTITDSEKLRLGRNVTATGMYLQSQPG